MFRYFVLWLLQYDTAGAEGPARRPTDPCHLGRRRAASPDLASLSLGSRITKLTSRIFRYFVIWPLHYDVGCWAWLGRAAGPGVPCLGAWLAPRAIPFRARAPYNEINDLEISLFRYMAAV